MKAFLGLPMLAGKKLVGVIGLANAPGGYGEQTIAYLEPMVRACANILAAWRIEQRRRQGEEDLRELNTRLAASNKELEAFSYSISHDLRARCGRSMASRAFCSKTTPQLPGEAQHYLQMTRQNVQQMGRLIDDLLAFSRLGRQALRKQPVDPAGLVRQTLEGLGSMQEGRRIDIRIGPLPVCQGDPILLKKVFLHLLDNALEIHPRSGRGEDRRGL